MHHPQHDLLINYANGEIEAVDGIAIAVHINACSHCHAIVTEHEIHQAELLEQATVEDSTLFAQNNMMDESALDHILELEMKTLDELKVEKTASEAFVYVNDKQFALPKPLHSIAHLIGSWTSYGGKVFSAEVALGEDQRVNLLYMNEGVKVPQHTHKGLESTLVLHGRFSDDFAQYEVGDFIQTDGSIKHSPYTKEGEDCLCLTILTQPMMFTQGVARVFNLFGRGMYP